MQTAAARAASDDQEIIGLLRGGEHEGAFERLLGRYQGRVYRLCYALLRERGAAEDAAQESLVRIWKALPRYDGRAALSTWIYAITRNRCLTALERRRVMVSLSDSEVGEAVESLASDASEGPEAQLDSTGGQGRSALLRELIELLPERPRRAVLLYYFEDRAIGEVAAMLGCPEGTVKSHLFRARALLTEQLRRRGLDDRTHWLESP